MIPVPGTDLKTLLASALPPLSYSPSCEMDESQQHTVLKSIAVSTCPSSNISPQDRQVAFQVLEAFKAYEGRIAVCIVWLHQERHMWENIDITIATKLYVLGILQAFLQKGYASLQESDRLALRHAVVTAARQLAPLPSDEENRILGNKLASLLAGLMVRDFPQRWTTFFQDIFIPTQLGGLWYDGEEKAHTMGVLVCLECLKLVTEDCTDSDFNARVRYGHEFLVVRMTYQACSHNSCCHDTDFYFPTKRCIDWYERGVNAVSSLTFCCARTLFCIDSI
jgi:Exportin 1-like protein